MQNFRSFRGGIASGMDGTGMRRTLIARKSRRGWRICGRSMVWARVRTAVRIALGNRRRCNWGWGLIREENHVPLEIHGEAGEPATQEGWNPADGGCCRSCCSCAGRSETGARLEVETCFHDYDGCGFRMFVCILGWAGGRLGRDSGAWICAGHCEGACDVLGIAHGEV